MSNRQNNFTTIKTYFEQLIVQSKTEQINKIAELEKNGLLNKEQVFTLKGMLKADDETGFATNIQEVSADIIEHASNQTPQFFENQQVGIYQIIKPLGQGGMGSVYLAKRNDGTFKQTVALKLPHSSFNPQMLQRFENERQILAQLSHNNIARLVDGGATENNQPYLVMEYIEGKDIDACCIKKQATLKQRIDLIIQTCAAVSYAHQKLILHRDLKPSNILVTESGQVKLLDFGIAKLLDDGNDNKTATQIMTRNYASPEQIQGKVVGTQSDLFSLAVIAYEIITGYHPFKSDNPHEREQNLVSGTITKITKRVSQKPQFPELATIPASKIKGDLENILLKALASKPDDRYQSVKDFAEDLSNFCNNKPVSARKASFFYKFSKLVQRHKIATFTILLSLATLIASSIFSYQKAKEAELERKISDEQRIRAQNEALKANSISNFMQDIFKKARPIAGKSEITAKDLLNQSMEQLKVNNELDAESKYNLMWVIFNSYIKLDNIQSLEDNIEGAYQSCVQELSDENRNCLMIYKLQAMLLHKLGNNEQAVTNYLLLEERIRQQKPLDKQLLSLVLIEQFSAQMNLDKFDVATKKLEEALRITRSLDNYNPSRINDARIDLAYAFMFNNKFEKASYYMHEINSYFIENSLENSLEMSSYYNLQSVYYALKHNPKNSIQYKEKAIKHIEKIYSDKKPEKYPFYIKGIAKMYFQAGELEKSIKAYEHAISYYRNFTNDTEKTIIQLLIQKALVYLALADSKNAEISLDSAEEIGLDKVISSRVTLCQHTYVVAHLTIINGTTEKAKKFTDEYQFCINKKKYNFYASYGLILDALWQIRNKDKDSARLILEQSFKLWELYPNDYLGIKKQVEGLLTQLD